MASDWPQLGGPSISLTELIYPIDFTPHSFSRKTRISPEDIKLIIENYKNGYSLKDISKVVGRSKNKIRRELIRNGIELRENIVQATNAKPLKRGKQGSRPYYGFCYFEGQITKDPREFPTLQLIHRRWSEHKSSHSIALELNRAKLYARNGRAWSRAVVRTIIIRFERKNILLHKGGKYEFR